MSTQQTKENYNKLLYDTILEKLTKGSYFYNSKVVIVDKLIDYFYDLGVNYSYDELENILLELGYIKYDNINVPIFGSLLFVTYHKPGMSADDIRQSLNDNKPKLSKEKQLEIDEMIKEIEKSHPEYFKR